MANTGLVYDYWKNTHGRRAIDNAASTVIEVVNVTENGQPMDNGRRGPVRKKEANCWDLSNMPDPPRDLIKKPLRR